MLEHQSPNVASALQIAHFAQDLNRLGRLGAAWQPPHLTAGGLTTHAQRLEGVGVVRSALAEFAARLGCCGWLETPQGLYGVDDGFALPATEVPLHAEMACGSQSLQLRWADGAWMLTQLTENAEPTQGQAVWAQEVDRLSSLHGISQWHYRLYFVATADGCLVPTASRLVAASP